MWIFVFGFSFLGFIHVLAVAQTMVFLTVDSLVWYALAGGIFLAFMGPGARSARSLGLHQTPAHSVPYLFCLQALIGGTAVIVLYVAYQLTGVLAHGHQVFASGILLFGPAFLAVSSAGLLAGAASFVFTETRTRGVLLLSQTSVIYALGILLAGLAFSQGLLFHAGMVQITLTAGLAGTILSLVVYLSRVVKKGPFFIIFSVGLALFLGVLSLRGALLERFFLERYYVPLAKGASWQEVLKSAGPGVELRRYHVKQNTIDVVRFPREGERELTELMAAYYLDPEAVPRNVGGWGVFVNGAPRVVSYFEALRHETFAHVPVLFLSASPRKVLILGGGDGLLARELLRRPSVEKIVIVDDTGLHKVLAREPVFRELQQGALEDERVTIIEADVFDFVRRDKGSYDAVYFSFPDPLDYEAGKLFSQEFFNSLRQRLASEGFMAMVASGWLESRAGRSPGEDKSFARDILKETLRRAGFGAVMPFYSRLEEDHAPALTLMQGLSGEDPALARDMLADYVRNLEAGFFLVLPEGVVLLQKEIFSSEGFRVLNEARFALSVGPQELLSFKGEQAHSIFHPRLPRPGSWWKTRSPY